MEASEAQGRLGADGKQFLMTVDGCYQVPGSIWGEGTAIVLQEISREANVSRGVTIGHDRSQAVPTVSRDGRGCPAGGIRR